MSKVFTGWKNALAAVRTITVIGQHRKGFKLYWRKKSRRAGRPAIDRPRISGELAKLGLTAGDGTVFKSMSKFKPDADKQQRRRTFLKNRAPGAVGIDFLIVRMIFFKAIYVFVAISHDRRKTLVICIIAPDNQKNLRIDV